MPKYKEYFKRMIEENKDVFDEFARIHFEYENDQEGKQQEFNKIGEKVQELVMEYENRLCSHSAKGQYAGFTPKLAAKFQDEVRKNFSMYDFIGVSIEDAGNDDTAQEAFNLRKISLN